MSVFFTAELPPDRITEEVTSQICLFVNGSLVAENDNLPLSVDVIGATVPDNAEVKLTFCYVRADGVKSAESVQEFVAEPIDLPPEAPGDFGAVNFYATAADCQDPGVVDLTAEVPEPPVEETEPAEAPTEVAEETPGESTDPGVDA